MGREMKKKQNTYAVHETVSGEEERITPRFKTKKELIDHLVKNGTEWDKPLAKEIAEEFVLRAKWVPSMIMCNKGILNSFDTLKLKLDE